MTAVFEKNFSYFSPKSNYFVVKIWNQNFSPILGEWICGRPSSEEFKHTSAVVQCFWMPPWRISPRPTPQHSFHLNFTRGAAASFSERECLTYSTFLPDRDRLWLVIKSFLIFKKAIGHWFKKSPFVASVVSGRKISIKLDLTFVSKHFLCHP